MPLLSSNESKASHSKDVVMSTPACRELVERDRASKFCELAPSRIRLAPLDTTITREDSRTIFAPTPPRPAFSTPRRGVPMPARLIALDCAMDFRPFLSYYCYFLCNPSPHRHLQKHPLRENFRAFRAGNTIADFSVDSADGWHRLGCHVPRLRGHALSATRSLSKKTKTCPRERGSWHPSIHSTGKPRADFSVDSAASRAVKDRRPMVLVSSKQFPSRPAFRQAAGVAPIRRVGKLLSAELIYGPQSHL